MKRKLLLIAATLPSVLVMLAGGLQGFQDHDCWQNGTAQCTGAVAFDNWTATWRFVPFTPGNPYHGSWTCEYSGTTPTIISRVDRNYISITMDSTSGFCERFSYGIKYCQTEYPCHGCRESRDGMVCSAQYDLPFQGGAEIHSYAVDPETKCEYHCHDDYSWIEW